MWRRARSPQVTISDERDAVLGTGGGVVKALPLLGDAPFFHVNADTMWIDGVRPNLARLAEAFDPARMDILLLMAPTTSSIGYHGRGDYAMAADGTLRKRKEHQVVPFVYAGVAIMSPAMFAERADRRIFADKNVRPRQRAGAAVRAAAGRRLDACRNPRRDRRRGRRLSRQRRVTPRAVPGAVQALFMPLPQSRDRTETPRSNYGPGSAAHRPRRATRCAASGVHAIIRNRPKKSPMP